jgi:flagellar hook protein FlgE
VRIPTSGMQAALGLLDAHAHNIANASTEDADTDLAGDVVGVLIAAHTYSANAKVFAVIAETERSLLDVRA